MIAGLHTWHNGSSRGSLVIALHGACATGRIWEGISGIFGNNVRFFAPDFLGHGASRSDQSLGQTSIEQYAKALVTLTYTFEHERINLLAHSMGCLVALKLAEQVPNIRKIVLLNSAPPQALITPRTAFRALKYVPSFLRSKSWRYTETDYRYLLCTSSTGVDMEPELASKLYRESVYESGKAALQMCLGSVRPVVMGVPIMVVAARGDRIVPLHFQRRMAAHYKTEFFEFSGTHLSVFDPAYAWVFKHYVAPWLEKQ